MIIENNEPLSSAGPNSSGDVRTGTTPEIFRQAILENLYFQLGRVPPLATPHDWYAAVAATVRDRLLGNWVKSMRLLAGEAGEMRAVSYLSAEFLIGPQLGNTLLCLGLTDAVRQAVAELGLDLDQLLEQEEEPGLGNGGLGRLAACFMDSLSTLGILSVGYGIRYEFGIFDQVIQDGWQTEMTDKWLRFGNPWELPRPEFVYNVGFWGSTQGYTDDQGRYRVRWIPHSMVKGMAYDYPVPGYRVEMVNMLRLWKSEAVESFDFEAFNRGDYYGAVSDKMKSETISKVLYPNDEPEIGKMLRLIQQYFFVCCSLQDMFRLHKMKGLPAERFYETFTVQLNDTHPAVAVAELMRLLVDEHRVGWEAAWETTQKTFAYTNHTLLPEALEKWPLPLFGDLLPRHLEIIFEINQRFLDEVRLKYPLDDERAARLSLIDETGPKYVRMAHLATLGSRAVNGVADLHSELLKQTVLRDFYELYPEKFFNVTNGVTLRRWVALSNPRLTELISEKIGEHWISQPEELKKLENLADDPEFQQRWRRVKQENKARLAGLIRGQTGITVDPESLFDIQVKRLHEYKRQHLNVLHVIALYRRLKLGGAADVPPRTVIFGGKAAPGYFMAKLIIKLIHAVGEVVNGDPDLKDRLKVVFYPDFNVKHAHPIYPAADLSEQISTAGKEASGTGNMKFSLNGALTIGTLDGANVEIREEVGAENFFLFGLSAEEVQRLQSQGYRPEDYYRNNEALREVLDLIRSGFFAHGDRELFRPLVDSLMFDDQYLLLADYQSYLDCQDAVGRAFLEPARWNRMSILNTARMGKFSSDRSIQEYNEKIWKVKPL
ncbi:MAG: glycogen/starch/alpha-glucan phosphorylase [Deltaproteobacteria bacterium]|nr:glycogen/starch/alpha-glucan phosphorylase [Deltaproteobacteria bacterium]